MVAAATLDPRADCESVSCLLLHPCTRSLGPPSIVPSLETVTRHCARMQMRLHRGKTRSMERDEPSPAGCDICSREPGPAESAEALDLLNRWLDDSASLDERAILVWAMNGHDAH